MIKNYQQALSFVNQFIQYGKEKYSGVQGLKRQQYILNLLDNPQDKIKTIHVAGTSGKGSTCFYLSSLLINHGFKVGLTLSPHLLDIRERMLINNQIITQTDFVNYLNKIIPAVNLAKVNNFGTPGYFEFLLLLSFYIFADQKVDYIVLETGVGGLLDSSNVVTRADKLCLLTKFGLDHTSILGPNIKSIASQKAGIIHKLNPVFSVNQIKIAKEVLNKTAKSKDTSINFVTKNNVFKNIKFHQDSISYDFYNPKVNFPKLTLNTIGIFQIENTALTLTAFLFLSQRDKFSFDEKIIRHTFLQSKFFGRMDSFVIKNQPIILDGAHNPQKIRSLLKSIKTFFPKQKFTVILSYKKRPDFPQMVKLITPIANTFIITSLKSETRDVQKFINKRENLTKIIKNNNQIKFQFIPSYPTAVKTSLKLKRPVLITGSFYLLGEIYPILKSLK